MSSTYVVTAKIPGKATDIPAENLGKAYDITVICRASDEDEVLASAVLNYTKIDGKEVPFLHCIYPLEGSNEERIAVLNWIISYCKARGENTLYAYNIGGKVEKGFLEKHGFSSFNSSLALITLVSD